MLDLKERENVTDASDSARQGEPEVTNEGLKIAVIAAAICAAAYYLTSHTNPAALGLCCLSLFLLLALLRHKIIQGECLVLAPLVVTAKFGIAVAAVLVPACVTGCFVSQNSYNQTPSVEYTAALVSLIPLTNLALILNYRHKFLSNLSAQCLSVATSISALCAAICIAGTSVVSKAICEGQMFLIRAYIIASLAALMFYKQNWRQQSVYNERTNAFYTLCAALLSMLCFAPEAREISIVAAMGAVADSQNSIVNNIPGTTAMN